MNNGGEAGGMYRRVGDLEAEVQALRRRVAALEAAAVVAASMTQTTPIAAATPGVVPQPATPPPARSPLPPPLPPSARSPSPAPSVPVAAQPAAAASPLPRPLAIPPRPPALSQPSALRDFLGAMHLLPPAGGGSREVQLGAWWATRIGALLVVIAVVFFGVYVSLATSPWVKLVELAAVSVGIAFFGAWIESKAARFGAVLLGAGLALVFFTAFAAYAVPAVKVIDDIVAAAFVQAAAVAIVYGVAVRRDSSTVATMATLLGYVSAFFALSEGFDDFAVVASLALALATVVFRCWRGWAMPLGVAAVLTHVVYAAVAQTIWSTPLGARSAPFAFAVLGAGFGAIFLSLVLEKTGADGRFSRAQHWIQSLNGSFAALAGFVAMWHVLSEPRHSWYFFGAAVVFAGAALWIWRTAREDPLFSVFAVKAATLLTLGVMTEWGARTRWVALLVQAFVLLAAARGAKRVALFVTTGLVWLVSFLFFAADIQNLEGRLVSGAGIAVALYTVGVSVLLTLLSRWWPDTHGGETHRTRVAFALVAAAPVALACPLAMEETWGPLALALLCAGFLGVARALRSSVPLAAGAVALLFGHAAIQDFPNGADDRAWLWAGAGLLCALSLACGWRAAEIEAPRRASPRAAWGTLGSVLQALGLSALCAGFFQTFALHTALALSVTVAAAVSWFGALQARPASTGAGVLALAVAVVLGSAHRGGSAANFGSTLWLWLAAAGAVATLAALGGERSGVRERLERSRTFFVLAMLAVFAGIDLVWLASTTQFGAIGETWSFVVAAAIYCAIAFGRRLGAGFAAASGLLAIELAGIVASMAFHRWPPAQQAWHALAAAFVAGVALAAVPVIAIQRARWLAGNALPLWRISHAVLAVLFIAMIAVQRHVAWSSYGSIVLALGGVVIFALGMFFRARSHRIAGLVALALCVVRVFVVDIHSALYRIAAFIVLGIVVLAVGFSYQRFRHWIEPDAADEDERKSAKIGG